MRVRLLCVLCTVGLLFPARFTSGQTPLEDLDLFRDSLDVGGQQPFVLRPFIREGSMEIYLEGELLPDTRYRVDFRYGRLWIDDLPQDGEGTLTAVYRTWGFVFEDRYRQAVRRTSDGEEAPATASDIPSETISKRPAAAQLRRTGSITRGILAGNNRDATVESGLRLQMDGKIADRVEVQAILTDESTPILPEGTTQRLDELDRVYIEIKTDRAAAQLGDFDVRYDRSEFARFNRKVQGAGANVDIGGVSAQVIGATARGIFRSQDIEIIDGVQGPYRLEGESGERFIFVVPGSEAVFVDGVAAQRGQTNDYVIDFATGEVTFTSNRLMRADNRVLIEYQYRTTEFTRTLVGADSEVSFARRDDGNARGRFGATFLRESDGRTFGLEFGLTEEDRALLEVLGDSTAAVGSAVQVPFEAEAPFVQYTQRDTVIAGEATVYYVAITRAPETPVYRVHFSHVGAGNGSYVREGRTANGILYEFRGPGGGAYNATRLLPRPQQQRMVDLRAGFEPVRGLEVYGEWAQSMLDENRLSDLDADNDFARAWIGGIRLGHTEVRLGSQELGAVTGAARRRYTGNRFATFSRTRPIEFARRWNLDSRAVGQSGSRLQQGTETIDEAHLQWALSTTTSLSTTMGRIRLDDSFTGTRSEMAFRLQERTLPRVSARREQIRSDDVVQSENGRWIRQRGRIEQPVGRFALWFEAERESRRQRSADTDSLASTSFAFTEYRPGIGFGSGPHEFGAQLELRDEDTWAEGRLRPGGKSLTLEANFDTRPARALRMEGRVGLRNRSYTEYFRTEGGLRDGKSVVMRWSGRWQPWKRAVLTDWLYEALTERAPTLQEIYIRTGPELGDYVWEDADGDGVPQIDEFLPERVQDEGVYARTLIPSDSLQSVIGVQTRFTVAFDPARAWKGSRTAWKRTLSNVFARTTVRIQEKSRNQQLSDVYLLKPNALRSQVHTLKGRIRVQQDLLLFRNRPAYGLNLTFSELRSLSELAAGKETHFVRLWKAAARMKPGVRWAVRLSSSSDRTEKVSETFSSRTYDIRSLDVEPDVSYSPSDVMQISVGVAFADKTSKESGTSARIWKVPVTAQYSLVRRLNITARLEGASVRIDGAAQTHGLAQFELTDGRGPGTSFLWNLNAWYQVSQILRATMSYNGRSPASGPTLHTLRISLSAVF